MKKKIVFSIATLELKEEINIIYMVHFANFDTYVQAFGRIQIATLLSINIWINVFD